MKRYLKSIFQLGKAVVKLPLEEQAVVVNELKDLMDRIAESPFANFLGLMQTYKIFDSQLDGSLAYFYRSRNSLWFKHFFVEEELYQLVKKDLEDLYPKYKHIKLLISDRGLVVYDNYQPDKFNILLLTIHAGSWISKGIREKMDLDEDIKTHEEDKGTNLLYREIALGHGGIWIDNKQSRFLCDFNRTKEKAIYTAKSEYWIEKFWKDRLTRTERKWIMESYNQFYGMLSKLVQTFRFNVIFDAHSMRHKKGRPELSFGTKHVKTFYLPIISDMENRLLAKFFEVKRNTPYSGGYILEWFHEQYPDVFIFSMEVNKKLYMNKEETEILKVKTRKLSRDMVKLFNYSED